MTEIFPVSAGVIVGLATFQLPSSALRWGVLGVHATPSAVCL